MLSLGIFGDSFADFNLRLTNLAPVFETMNELTSMRIIAIKQKKINFTSRLVRFGMKFIEILARYLQNRKYVKEI